MSPGGAHARSCAHRGCGGPSIYSHLSSPGSGGGLGLRARRRDQGPASDPVQTAGHLPGRNRRWTQGRDAIFDARRGPQAKESGCLREKRRSASQSGHHREPVRSAPSPAWRRADPRGQQDRVISKNTLLAPRQQASLEVYCVEHGRWQGRSDFQMAGGIAAHKIRVRAEHRSDQGQVWQAVAAENAALGAAPPTGTYRNIATGSEGTKATQAYRDAIGAGIARLPQSKQMVGIIAAINGRVVSMDVFSTPELFASHRDRLLDSIFISAATAPVTKPAGKPPTASDIKSFVLQADKAKADVIADDERSRTTQRHAKDVVSSTVEAKSGGAIGGAVYKSYQANE